MDVPSRHRLRNPGYHERVRQRRDLAVRTKVFTLLMASLCILAFACGERGEVRKSGYVPVTEFDPSRDAAQDIDAAVAEAKHSGRRVLLDVGGEWCIWCKKLDQFFDRNEDVAGFLRQNFVVVKVNFSPRNKNERVLSRYPDIPGFPHLFVLDDAGRLLRSQDTAELEEGDHHDRGKVLAFLRRWAPG